MDTYNEQYLIKDLLESCNSNNPEAFKSTIEKIKNLQHEESPLKKFLGQIDEGGKNLFLEIISMGGPDIIQILFNEGIMPDEFKDSEGKTALMNAIEDYEYSKVETLIQNGSDINFKISASGITPMSLAIYHGWLEIVKLLIKNGANLTNIKNQQNALCYSAKIHDGSGTDSITQEILEIIYNDIIEDSEGSNKIKEDIKKDSSIIYIITKYNNPKLLKALLEKGILDSNNNNNLSIIGCSPLIYAATNDRIDEAKILLDFGAKITATDNRGIDAKTHIERLLIKFLKKLYSEDREDFNKRIKNLEELITQSEASEGFEYKENYKIRIDSASAEKIIDSLQDLIKKNNKPSCSLGPFKYTSEAFLKCLTYKR
jgi:ankyrin repeat protein